MKRIITGLAMLAALGSSISAASPALAQIDCNDPRLAMMYCRNQPPGAQLGPQTQGNTGGQRHNRGDNNPPPQPQGNDGQQFHRGDNYDNNGPRHYDNNGPRHYDNGYRGPDFGPGQYNGRPDRNRFFREFRSFDFAPFAVPTFPIRPGYVVPRYYDLRPVPRSLWIYYPEYRGYLFFETRDGTIVIVNPRTYRIVAIF